MTDPRLQGRRARCACGMEADSSMDLAFFEYMGEGSPRSKDCDCGYAKVAHGEINEQTGRPGITEHPYEPRGGEAFDRFYCGCFGWD